MVHVLTDDQTATACPACEVLVLGAAAPHDPAARPALRRGTAEARWHKVQYACREALCGRKAFTEQIAEVPLVQLAHTMMRLWNQNLLPDFRSSWAHEPLVISVCAGQPGIRCPQPPTPVATRFRVSRSTRLPADVSTGPSSCQAPC